jgi:hypothetical protein
MVNDRDRFDSATLRKLRSIALFVVGLGGIVYEIAIDHAERPTLLILLSAMVGLPAFLKTDEKRRPDTPPDRDGDPP